VIRNIRAVAIDDEKDHLDAIFDAAIKAGSLAYTWANHTIRPGIVSFAHGDTDAAEVAQDVLAEELISATPSKKGWLTKITSWLSGS
jgi:hypothetical protein